MVKVDDSLDDAALKALLLRHAEAWWERAFLRRRMAADQRRVDALSGRIADCDTSFRVFGYDVKQNEVWKKLVGRYEAEIDPQLRVLSEKFADYLEEEEGDGSDLLPAPEQQPIHHMVLDRLKEAGTSGSKAAPIRAYIEGVLGREIHEKTVGMTLYRLLKRGAVRREGHTWFFVPEAKDSGAVTPELLNRDDKKGEEP